MVKRGAARPQCKRASLRAKSENEREHLEKLLQRMRWQDETDETNEKRRLNRKKQSKEEMQYTENAKVGLESEF